MGKGISIVICGTLSSIPSELEENIKSTIGNSQYELIYFDNSIDSKSIFQIYNTGLSKAIYPYVCFMHQDILFESKNWGDEVCENFNKNDVAILGVIGSKFANPFPLGWWSSLSKSGIVKERERGLQVYSTEVEEVVTVDGLWFVLNRELVPNFQFDSNVFSGFHYYDMDTCLTIREFGYKILVVPSIRIFHNSGGRLDDLFFINAIKCYNKHRKHLPAYTITDKEEIKKNFSYYKAMNSINSISEYVLRKKPYSIIFCLGSWLDNFLSNQRSDLSILCFRICKTAFIKVSTFSFLLNKIFRINR